MSSTVAAADRIESSSAEGYLATVEAALFGALREVTLAEPRVTDADRALRALADLAATYTGFMLGAIARHVLGGLRRWFGEDGAAMMRTAMRGWPVMPARIDAACTDTTRPLAGSLLAQLHVRSCLVAGQARRLVEAVPDRPMIGMTFGVLAGDDQLARRLVEELARGWAVYTAAVTTRRYPELTPLWQQFVWQLDGRPAPARDAIAEAGYIVLVR